MRGRFAHRIDSGTKIVRDQLDMSYTLNGAQAGVTYPTA